MAIGWQSSWRYLIFARFVVSPMFPRNNVKYSFAKHPPGGGIRGKLYRLRTAEPAFEVMSTGVHHGINSAEGGGHNVFLERSEAVVTEHLLQQGGEAGGGRGRGIGVHVGVGWWIWMSLYQLPESRSNEQFGEGGFF